MTRSLTVFLFSSLFSLLALAQKNLVERTYEGQSNDKNPVVAKTEIINQATEKISEDLIKEIIGEGKYVRNKPIISNKIMKQSARFIPYSKPGDLKPLQPEGFKMGVTLKVSVDDLQSLLLANGLFYESDGTPIVLPTVRFIDRVNARNYSWWSEADANNKGLLAKESRNLEESLKSTFLKSNFYLLRPQSLKFLDFLPPALRVENLHPEDWQLISQRLGAQIVVDGEVVITKSQERSEAFAISLKLTALQVMNGRVIAEVARQFETDGGVFDVVVDRRLKEVLESVAQDLSGQVLEAWQKGALGASLYKLTVRGRLPLLQQEAFKEILKNKVREVKNVRERQISAESVVFEVDSALGPKELGQKAGKIEVGNFVLVLESASDTEAIYKLTKTNPVK